MGKLRKLKTGWSVPPGLLVLWGIVDALSNIESIIGWMKVIPVGVIGQFMTSGEGNLLAIIIGIGWLSYLLLRSDKGNDIVGASKVEFYNSRSEAPDLKALFGRSKTITCLFQTGTTIKETDFFTWAKGTKSL